MNPYGNWFILPHFNFQILFKSVSTNKDTKNSRILWAFFALFIIAVPPVAGDNSKKIHLYYSQLDDIILDSLVLGQQRKEACEKVIA